ncbi:MAG: MATE family efflux transporter [Tissierellia bacterium]|nr:MATE family efflux transporter [Tissierellia bacterium]
MILYGPSKKVLLVLSMPLIFSNIMATLYSLADGVWLSRLSYTQFAATSLTWPLLFLFISIAIGISVAGTSIISQMIGAGKKDRASKYANNLIIISIFMGIIFSIMGYFLANPIIRLMGAKDDLLKHSTTYLKVNSLGFLIDNLYFAFQAILNAQGNTKSTTTMGITSGLLNILLDPFFIFAKVPFIGLPGLNLGVAGAALATLLAKFVALIIGFIVIRKNQSEVEVNGSTMKYESSFARHLMRLAIPTAIGRSSAALGFTVMNAIIVSYGQELVAAFSMVNRITDFWMQISMGISAAMTAMIGQNMGAGNYSRARQIVKDASFMTLISSAVGMLIVGFFPKELLSIFIDIEKDVDVYKIAMEYIPYAVAIEPFMGFFNIFQGAFQGVGQMKYSMHMSTGRLWFIRVPFVLFMQNFTQVGRVAIWISMLISNVLIVIYSYYIYQKKDIIPKEGGNVKHTN